MNNLIEKLKDITPIHKIGNISFKREDLFRPIQSLGVNGSKLRQLIWLLLQAQESGVRDVFAGAVSASPQHIMVSAVCKELSMQANLVTGAKDISKFPMLIACKNLGANIISNPVGYAKTLESKCFKLSGETPNSFVVETNITLDEKRNSWDKIKKFHNIGAFQSINIPDNIDTLFLPCGSCNSAVSSLYGLYLFKKNIKNIACFGIGNIGSKNIMYIFERLKGIDEEAYNYISKMNLFYYNLNGSGYCNYSDLMKYNYAGIEFHPRYEGKIMNYIEDNKLFNVPEFGNILFWVVGSEPI